MPQQIHYYTYVLEKLSRVYTDMHKDVYYSIIDKNKKLENNNCLLLRG